MQTTDTRDPDSRDQDTLEWHDSGLDLVPRWTRLPQLDAIEQVCRRTLGLTEASDPCRVSFYAAGAFNRLYLAEGFKRPGLSDALLRVSLPVDPKYKTAGEVATLRWIRAASDVPVPRVYDFDDTVDNDIGFEWILMERMPGVTAYQHWRTMSMADKTDLVDQIAVHQSRLFRESFDVAQFRGIGTLEDGGRKIADCRPGRMVSRTLFWGPRRGFANVDRGPYSSSRDWLHAELAILQQEQSSILDAMDSNGNDNDDDDEDDREQAEDILQAARKLESLLPKVFPDVQSPEQTVLWHDDLSLQNILVDKDDNSKVTAIIDWESVATAPLWVAAGMPQFLIGSDREEEPQRDTYGDESESGINDDDDDDEPLDNEGKTIIYWEHLMEFEQTQLRRVYAARMTKLWPRWAEEAADAPLKADFYKAMSYCADGYVLKRITRWVDAVEAGKRPRLHDVPFHSEQSGKT